MEERLLQVRQLAVLLKPELEYAITVAPIISHLLVLVKIVCDFILPVVARCLGSRLVFEAKDGYVDAFTLGILLLSEDLLLIPCVISLLNQVLDDVRITILRCNMQRGIIAIRTRV